jgi:hypothetical protein
MRSACRRAGCACKRQMWQALALLMRLLLRSGYRADAESVSLAWVHACMQLLDAMSERMYL